MCRLSSETALVNSWWCELESIGLPVLASMLAEKQRKQSPALLELGERKSVSAACTCTVSSGSGRISCTDIRKWPNT